MWEQVCDSALSLSLGVNVSPSIKAQRRKVMLSIILIDMFLDILKPCNLNVVLIKLLQVDCIKFTC